MNDIVLMGVSLPAWLLLGALALGFVALGALGALAAGRWRAAKKERRKRACAPISRLHRHENAPAWGKKAREEQLYSGR